jgi:hypothetical protein
VISFNFALQVAAGPAEPTLLLTKQVVTLPQPHPVHTTLVVQQQLLQTCITMLLPLQLQVAHLTLKSSDHSTKPKHVMQRR